MIGTGDDVAIPINANSITVTYLDAGTGGTGRELITFQSDGTLTNNLYQVSLLNTGPDSFRDIAGNTPANPIDLQFVVDVASLQHNIFVGPNPGTAPDGTRGNPYPTIGQAMSVAVAGDVVAVLPGVYTEQVTLKPLVKLFSAALSSTDNTVFTTSTGNPLSTIIRAPLVSTPRPACTRPFRRRTSRASARFRPRSPASRSPPTWSATRQSARSIPIRRRRGVE